MLLVFLVFMVSFSLPFSFYNPILFPTTASDVENFRISQQTAMWSCSFFRVCLLSVYIMCATHTQLLVFVAGWDIKSSVLSSEEAAAADVTRSLPKLFHHVFVTILICFSLSSHALYGSFSTIPLPFIHKNPFYRNENVVNARSIHNSIRLWFSKHCFITTLSLCRENISMYFEMRHSPLIMHYGLGLVCVISDMQNEFKLTWTMDDTQHWYSATMTHIIESSNKSKFVIEFINQKFN